MISPKNVRTLLLVVILTVDIVGFKSNLEEEDSAMNASVPYPKVDVEVVYPNALTTQEVTFVFKAFHH